MKAILLTLFVLTFSLAGQAENRPAQSVDSTELKAKEQINSLLHHIKIYCRTATHAQQVFKRAETLSKEYLDHYKTLDIKMEKGRFYARRGDYRRALRSFVQGLPYLPPAQRNPPHTAGWFLMELGELLYRLAFYEEAYDKFKEAQEHFVAEKYLYGQSVAVNNLGLCRLKQEQAQAALRNFREAGRLRRKDSLASIYRIHSKIYQIRALLALDSGQQALTLLREIEKPTPAAGAEWIRKRVYEEWGRLYFQRQNFQEALRYLDSGRVLSKRSYDPLFETRLELKITQVHLAQGNWKQAEKYAQQGLQKAKAHQQMQYQQEFLSLLATISEKLGYEQKRIRYLEALDQVHKALLKRDKQILKDVLTLKEKTYRYVEAIDNLEEKSAAQQDQIRNQNRINILVSILVILAAGGLVFFYRLNRKLRRYRSRLTQYGERSMRAANGLSNVIIALDENWKIIFLNQSAEELTQIYWNKVPKLGAYFGDLLKDENEERYWTTRLERSRNAESWQEMSEIHTTQGALFYLFTFASIFIEKEYKGVVILGTDVTEPHRRNIDLQQKSAELEKALETKERMLSILAHDLKEGINSSLELVKVGQEENLSKKEYGQYFDLLNGNLSKTQTLLFKTLDWVHQQSQPQTGAHKFKFYRLANDLERAFSDIFQKKGIVLKSEYPEGLELEGEPGAIMTVLRNLLSNAAKFTPAQNGEVCLRAEVDEGQQEAIISVKDNGVGMDKEQLEALLGHNPLQSTVGTKGEKGTGMGIKLCQQLLAQNQSKLQVISEKEKGSQFYFRLPIAP